MDALAWGRCYVTGVDELDRQRRELARLVSHWGLPKLRDDGLVPGFDAIVARLQTCFDDEERILGERELDTGRRDDHGRAHRDFLGRLADLRPDADALPGSVELLREYMAAWLEAHYLGLDRDLSSRQRRTDHDTEPATDQASLLAAMKRLIQAQDRQNRDLVQANQCLGEKLALRGRALAEARSRLEAEQKDMTDLLGKVEEAQRLLIHTEKMAAIGQLAAGISHEVNNPVGFVLSNFTTLEIYVDRLLNLVKVHEKFQPTSGAGVEELAAARYAADYDYLWDDLRALMRESREGLERVRRIVQNLKDFSHVDEADWQASDLNAGMSMALKLLNDEITGRAAVNVELGVPPPVYCIPAQINQVFLILLNNALQSLRQDKGRISVRSGQQRDLAWFEVEDNGCGMQPEIRHRIFEPFFSTRPVGQGTGLGLSLAWDIVVQRHGGSFDVQSEPGVGTRVRIWLPTQGPLQESLS